MYFGDLLIIYYSVTAYPTEAYFFIFKFQDIPTKLSIIMTNMLHSITDNIYNFILVMYG